MIAPATATSPKNGRVIDTSAMFTIHLIDPKGLLSTQSNPSVCLRLLYLHREMDAISVSAYKAVPRHSSDKTLTYSACTIIQTFRVSRHSINQITRRMLPAERRLPNLHNFQNHLINVIAYPHCGLSRLVQLCKPCSSTSSPTFSCNRSPSLMLWSAYPLKLLIRLYLG